MAIAVPLNAGTSPTLKQRLKHAERINRWKAQALIAPLVLFLLLVFLVPIVALLFKKRQQPGSGGRHAAYGHRRRCLGRTWFAGRAGVQGCQ
nr:hypothetical protein GCM10020185_41610 [Pseudomonas brassicacearum subsp. brassicacearum]